MCTSAESTSIQGCITGALMVVPNICCSPLPSIVTFHVVFLDKMKMLSTAEKDIMFDQMFIWHKSLRWCFPAMLMEQEGVTNTTFYSFYAIHEDIWQRIETTRNRKDTASVFVAEEQGRLMFSAANFNALMVISIATFHVTHPIYIHLKASLVSIDVSLACCKSLCLAVGLSIIDMWYVHISRVL